MLTKTKFSLVSLLCFIAVCVHSQDFERKFKELGPQDTSGQLKVLIDWEKAEPKNPELYVAYFNFYVKKSMREVISLDPQVKSNEALQISDSSKNTIAYLNASVNYKSDVLQKGFDYIDKGISLHPTRLDMRFGKIYMLGKAENYPVFTKVIIETINYDNSIKHAWLWKEGKQLEDAKEFFLSSMQDYINTLYNTEDNRLLPNMRQISETIIKYNPDHVISLANIALTYAIEEENDKALEYLLKAEKIDPKDIIVLNNIAESYVRKKENAKAKAYFEKIIKNGNEDDAARAKERMKELNL